MFLCYILSYFLVYKKDKRFFIMLFQSDLLSPPDPPTWRGCEQAIWQHIVGFSACHFTPFSLYWLNTIPGKHLELDGWMCRAYFCLSITFHRFFPPCLLFLLSFHTFHMTSVSLLPFIFHRASVSHPAFHWTVNYSHLSLFFIPRVHPAYLFLSSLRHFSSLIYSFSAPCFCSPLVQTFYVLLHSLSLNCPFLFSHSSHPLSILCIYSVLSSFFGFDSFHRLFLFSLSVLTLSSL